MKRLFTIAFSLLTLWLNAQTLQYNRYATTPDGTQINGNTLTNLLAGDSNSVASLNQVTNISNTSYSNNAAGYASTNNANSWANTQAFPGGVRMTGSFFDDVGALPVNGQVLGTSGSGVLWTFLNYVQTLASTNGYFTYSTNFGVVTATFVVTNVPGTIVSSAVAQATTVTGSQSNLISAALTNGDTRATSFPNLALSASQVTGVLTNPLALANSLNIPLPYMWNDFSAANTSVTTNIPDLSGNGNTLGFYTDGGYGNSVLINPTIMNGRQGIASQFLTGWTNGTAFAGANATTNFTLFLVYRDTAWNLDSSLLVFGTTSANPNTYFNPTRSYNGGTGYGSDAGWYSSTWNAANGQGNTAYVLSKANYQVEITTLRNGLAGDSTIWQNGVINQQLGALATSAVATLTNTIQLGVWMFNNQGSHAYNGELMIYTNALSNVDVARVHNYLKLKYNFMQKSLVICGASVAAGVFANPNSNLVECVQRLLPTYEVSGAAVSGASMEQQYTNFLGIINQQRWHDGSVVYFSSDPSGNDSTNGFVEITNYIPLIASACFTNGYQLLLSTLQSSYNQEVNWPGVRTNVNNWIYANWQKYASGFIDLAANPFIGPLGAYTNTAWFDSGQNHPVTNAYPLIYAPLVASAVQTLTTDYPLFSRPALGLNATSSGIGTAGTGSLSASANDFNGIITITTGTVASGGTAICTNVFTAPYTQKNLTVTLSANNAAAAALSGLAMVYPSVTSSNMVINVGTTGLASSTTYVWAYSIK